MKFIILLTLIITLHTQKILVLNKAGSSLDVFDSKTLNHLAKVPVGNSPHEVVSSEDGKLAIVANYGDQSPGNTLSIIDLKTYKETKRVNLEHLNRPHGIQVLNNNVYFTSEQQRVVGRYNLNSDKVDFEFPTKQRASHMLVTLKNSTYIFTANIVENTVSFINKTSKKVDIVHVGGHPEAIDISPDGKFLWVGLNQDNAIDIIDIHAKKVIQRVNIGSRPYRVKFSPNGEMAVSSLPNEKTILIHDAKTYKDIKRIQLDDVPLGLIVSKDNKYLYATTVQTDKLYKIDLETFKILKSVKTDLGPDGIDLAY